MFAHTFVYEAFKFLFSIPLVEEVFTVVDAILRNIAIVRFGVDGVDGALGPGKWVAKLICGTLAGAGGGFWIGKQSKQCKSMFERKQQTIKNQIMIRFVSIDSSSLVILNPSLAS